MKPRCENCRHHKVDDHEPASWFVSCALERPPEDVMRWYRCEQWTPRAEKKAADTGEQSCRTCRHSEKIYRDEDCPYLACTLEGATVPKWSGCDMWETR